ncbi:MAG TPA: saccharopine dehydrogenase NADP-binding domain-containing protein [Actinomycetota bacterium]|nr:saccharopine dehydrogenase NADP-binding domain-containing protein [Actinomycetota bacterium]
MPEILLFGATGYTGKLTAHALARRGADFAIAGRNRSKLEALAATTGGPEVRVASVGDVDGLVDALDGVKVLITCVGPFATLGQTAIEAALRAKVHYIDSTGEGPFIGELIENKNEQARRAGIAMTPAMGFDEVPADVAATKSTEGMEQAELTLTYALPTQFSTGTLRSVLGIAASTAVWLENGRPIQVKVGEKQRWAPMPPPLGPRASLSFPLAEARLAPLHLDLRSVSTYMTVGAVEKIGMKAAAPFMPLLANNTLQNMFEKVLERLPEGPNEQQRSKSHWTILGEARAGSKWRNVAISGTDVYGLTAEFLSAGAIKVASEGPADTGVLAPVQAVGLETFEKVFAEHGVNVDVYEARSEE